MNIYILELQQLEFCSKLAPVWTIIGYVIFAIKIVVPLLLIVSGMIALAQAVIKQKEEDIKKAQNLLVKKLIAAVLVYLIITFVNIVVGLVSSEDYKACAQCATSPFGNYDAVTYDANGKIKLDANGNPITESKPCGLNLD